MKNKTIKIAIEKALTHEGFIKHKKDEHKILLNKLHNGLLSDVYTVRLPTKTIICKIAKRGTFCGNERAEDQISMLATGQRIESLTEPMRKSHLFIFSNKDCEAHEIPTAEEDDIVLQLQEYFPGENYLRLLLKKKNFSEHETIIRGIATKLAALHRIKPKLNQKEKESYYTRSLRDILLHPDLSFAYVLSNLRDNTIFRGKFKRDYLLTFWDAVDYFHDKKFSRRISLVHGDLIPNNILVDNNGEIRFIDYSRFVFGEPGIDVGGFYISLIWLSFTYKDASYRRLAELFLKVYISTTRDPQIKRTATLYTGFAGLIALDEKFTPSASKNARIAFANYTLKCLKKKRLLIPEA